MGSFIVTTDSGCDLPLSFCSSRGIIPLKMNYAIGDKNYTDTMDPKDLKSFYDEPGDAVSVHGILDAAA